MMRRPTLAPPRTVPVGQARRTLEAVRVFRTNFVFGVLLILLILLLGRFATLQLVEGAAYRAQADRRHAGRMSLPGIRGRILDRHGRLLATSAFGREVAVDPDPTCLPEDEREVFCVYVASLLESEGFTAGRIRREIEAALARRRLVHGPLGLSWMRTGTRHLVLAAHVDEPRVVAALDEAVEQRPIKALRALKVRCVERRAYPNGDYALNVIGLPAPAGAVGRMGEGVEGLMDRHLLAEEVSARVCRDGRSQCFSDAALFDRDLLGGRDVHLTLDIVVQHHVEQALDALQAEWKPFEAAAIVMDPRTGAVLALANRAVDRESGRPVRPQNLAIGGRFEPGSVFKPFTVAWALRQGLDPDHVIPMPISASFKGGGSPIRDTHYVGDGDVVLLLTQSSNTGAAWLADFLGPDALKGLFAWVGLDQTTGIELPHEVCFGRAHALAGRSDLLRSGFGHAFTITPIRLASAFSAFARADGRAARPTLLLDATSPVAPGEPICAPKHLAVVRRGLEGCVNEGTAVAAFRDAPFRAAGKTGTALVSRDREHVCSFAGYAPAHDPRLVVLVTAVTLRSQDGSGGRVSAPAVRRIMERTLGYMGRLAPSATAGSPVVALEEAR
jgi:cell division protein FtsI/penicillin-binding protein 2